MAFKFGKNDRNSSPVTSIMGILNVTPDSFSDGAEYLNVGKAVRHALEMLDAGASIIDVGGESTRPGAERVSVEVEISRVCPVIEELKKQRPRSVVSVDTRNATTARVAIKSGADIINDISGLQHSEEMAGTVAEFGVGLILMHMRGMPENMQNEENLQYECLLEDICLFLKKAVEKAVAAGVKKESIAVDPGIGFSKNLHQNLEIIKNIDYFRKLGYPVLAGPSRKSFIGELLEQENPGKRVWGTAGAAVFLALKKVDILRVHDVKEISEAVTVAIACKNGYRK